MTFVRKHTTVGGIEQTLRQLDPAMRVSQVMVLDAAPPDPSDGLLWVQRIDGVPTLFARVDGQTVALGGGRVTARTHAGDPAGPRPQLAFVAGDGINIAVNDHADANEIDVTIAASGGTGGGNEDPDSDDGGVTPNPPTASEPPYQVPGPPALLVPYFLVVRVFGPRYEPDNSAHGFDVQIEAWQRIETAGLPSFRRLYGWPPSLNSYFQCGLAVRYLSPDPPHPPQPPPEATPSLFNCCLERDDIGQSTLSPPPTPTQAQMTVQLDAATGMFRGFFYVFRGGVTDEFPVQWNVWVKNYTQGPNQPNVNPDGWRYITTTTLPYWAWPQ